MTIIIGVKLTDRAESSVEFQEILSKYGCSIRTRIGLHHPENNSCTNCGVVLLDLANDEPKLIEELSKQWVVQVMKFD